MTNPKATTLGFGLARNTGGQIVVREGTLRKEQRVELYDTMCPCDRASQKEGTATMCWMCSGPQIICVDHTDGDL